MSNKIGEFIISDKTKYWLYLLDDKQWEYLREQFKKNKYYISSFENTSVSKSDIILIYCENRALSGIVCICQTKTLMKSNLDDIKIFNDNNMNKFYIKLEVMIFFKTSYRFSDLDLKFDIKIFKNKYIKKKFQLINIDKNIGKNIVKKIVELSREPEQIQEQIQEQVQKQEQEPDQKELNITTGKCKGHIPILFDPCNDFKWSDDKKEIVKHIIKHYKSCKKCERIDNNYYSELIESINKSEIKYYDLKDNKLIEKYLDYYHELKIFNFKNKNEIFILRVNKNEHIYHKCILILF
jgi:hypothetical protein